MNRMSKYMAMAMGMGMGMAMLANSEVYTIDDGLIQGSIPKPCKKIRRIDDAHVAKEIKKRRARNKNKKTHRK